MTQMPTRIGPYQVVREIGRGGMGVVYLARDARLDRDVAIKALPEDLAADPDRLARFEREGKAVAQLSHPNVAGIYGVEESDGQKFLILEYVEGTTLGERLKAGPIPIGEALEFAVGIAAGLEAAHDVGVIHRDLKPDNIKITPDGQVKVLDFGLAKSDPVSSGTNLADSPTITTPRSPTIPGAILGTAAYMSPEQARGRKVDKRTDIWSFGVIMYEMLTGINPFVGETVSDSIGAVLHKDVDVHALRAGVPAGVHRLLERCLRRDQQRRQQSIGDARIELEDASQLLDSGEAGSETTTVPESPRRAASWIGAIAIVGMIAAIGGLWMEQWTKDPVETWSQFTQLTDEEGAETGPTLSPDGNSFAYASRIAGSWDIYVQRVGGRNRTAVAADPERDEAWPAFSPDGSLIAYNESGGDGGIWVVGATGESHRRLTDFGFNPAWSPDGKHLAFTTEEVLTPYHARRSKLWKVSATGGEPVQLCDSDAFQPAWSPSGARVAIWFQKGGQRDLATVPGAGGERLVVLEDAPLDWSPTWSPDGRYLYFSSDRGGSMGLWRIPIEEASGRATGEPESVANGLESSMSLPHFSRDGRVLAFRSETVSVNPVVIPFDPEAEEVGAPRALLQRTGILRPADVSPDGKLLALFNLGEHQEDIFVMRTDGSGLRRLTDDLARDRRPCFSPDGELLTFNSNRDGVYRAYSIRLDGSALSLLTDTSIDNVAYPAFQPGGEHLLAYIEFVGYVLAKPPLPFGKDAYAPLPKIELPSGEMAPTYSMWTWSPDGRMIAGELKHTSRASEGIGVHDLDSGTGRLLSTDASLSTVHWLPDSRRVIYFRNHDELAIIDVETGEQRVIPVDLPFPLGEQSSAVAPDGTAIYYGGERVESNIWIVERSR